MCLELNSVKLHLMCLWFRWPVGHGCTARADDLRRTNQRYLGPGQDSIVFGRCVCSVVCRSRAIAVACVPHVPRQAHCLALGSFRRCKF